MESRIGIAIAAPPERVYTLAAAVEDWPHILPHYRWVRRVGGTASRPILEMAARRDFAPLPFAYPVHWTAAVQAFPDTRRIRFRHLRGPTRGMQVEWRVEPAAGGTRVTIWHRYRPRLPLLGAVYAEWIAGRIFIAHIAGRTLACMKQEAERRESVSYHRGQER